ncbi:protein RALF-like 34 [Populus alba x Populus x berolinensis]|uniref:Protein RALF-like 34 n=1 Tax=Populus alba TaxID=43335 RepID=A0A4U5N8N0_POPAL|nr:protein RALF-like 34 [Populus alba x Populus x berolinensis]TKR78834.1 protein RALF-like 34 [Populus alba]
MRVSALSLIVASLTFLVVVKAQVDLKDFIQLTSEDLEWPSALSVYDELSDNEDGEYGVGSHGRSLHGRAKHYYVSYGALSANRVPCPARSGRSYYTHNCFRSRGQANPYTRGCSCITHCRR